MTDVLALIDAVERAGRRLRWRTDGAWLWIVPTSKGLDPKLRRALTKHRYAICDEVQRRLDEPPPCPSVMIAERARLRERFGAAGDAMLWPLMGVRDVADFVCRHREALTRFLGRAQRPISFKSIARLSGISAKMAKALLMRRAKRMATALPRTIKREAATPWGELASERLLAEEKHPSSVARH